MIITHPLVMNKWIDAHLAQVFPIASHAVTSSLVGDGKELRWLFTKKGDTSNTSRRTKIQCPMAVLIFVIFIFYISLQILSPVKACTGMACFNIK